MYQVEVNTFRSDSELSSTFHSPSSNDNDIVPQLYGDDPDSKKMPTKSRHQSKRASILSDGLTNFVKKYDYSVIALAVERGKSIGRAESQIKWFVLGLCCLQSLIV